MENLEIMIKDAFDYTAGYKSQWMLVKSIDSHKIIEFLKKIEIQKQGIMLMHINWSIYVSKPYKEWTFVLGEIPVGYRGADDKLLYLLSEFSRQFGETQFFASHRGVDYYGWGKAIDGHILQLHITSQLGIEKNIGILSEKEKDMIGEYPDEDSVIALAELWGINPLLIPETEWNSLCRDSLCIIRKMAVDTDKFSSLTNTDIYL